MLSRNNRGIHIRVHARKLPLVLANKVILGSEFHGTHDHTLLSDGSAILQTTDSPYDTDSIENDASNNSSNVACIHCLPSSVLTRKRDTYTDTQSNVEGFMK
jgi:hypothetical protein